MKMKKLDDIDPKELDKLARKQAEIYVKKDRLKTHQLRNIFSAIEKMRTLHKRILRTRDKAKLQEMKEDLKRELILLKPKIAYAAGRQRSVKYNFFPFVEEAINAVEESDDSKKAYQNFFALMESIVGYHKFFESN